MRTAAIFAMLALLVACGAHTSVLGSTQRELMQNGGPAPAPAPGPAPGPAADMTCQNPSEKPGYSCKMTPPGLDAMTVHWVLGPVTGDLEEGPTPAEGEISVLLEGTTTGWLALGFAGEALQMNPSDVVLGYVGDDQTVDVRSYQVLMKSIAPGDEDDSVPLTNISGSDVDGVTTIEFTRALDAGMFPIDPAAGPVRTNAAHGADGEDGLIYHSTNRVAFFTDLMTGEVSTSL